MAVPFGMKIVKEQRSLIVPQLRGAMAAPYQQSIQEILIKINHLWKASIDFMESDY